MAEKKQKDEIVEETGAVADASALGDDPTAEVAAAAAADGADEVAEPEAESQAVNDEPVVEEPVVEDAPAEEPVAEEATAGELVAEEAPAEEPVADVEDVPEPDAGPAAEPAAEAGPTPSAPAQPERKKRKRLPRRLRPTKGRVQREKATERKPITRIPKPEREFGRRQERQGTVVSDKGDKTIVVKVDTIKAHPRYKKVVRRSKQFHAHDEQNAAKIGDVVKIVETRPISKTKNWRLAEIVEVAK